MPIIKCEFCKEMFKGQKGRKFCSARCFGLNYSAERPIETRLWKQVDKDGPVVPYVGTPCWIWVGFKNEQGYGRISFQGKFWLTHRLSYFLHFGTIPDGIDVLHRCDNPSCVNPNHLWLGDNKANDADKRTKGRAYIPIKGLLLNTNPARGDRHAWHVCPERMPIGEKKGTAKLKEAQVREIKRRWSESPKKFGLQAQMSREYGVSKHTIMCIVKNRTWKHI